MSKILLYRIVQKGSHGQKLFKVFDTSIMLLITLSILAIILESVPEINSKYGDIIRYFDNFTIIIFTLEYLVRLYISDLTHPSGSRLKSGFKFAFSTFGLIDLLAIAPVFLPMIFQLDLRFIRIARLTRVFRILKINRYNDSLQLIINVVKEKKSELIVTAYVTFIVVFLASFIMYYVEGDKQPEAFPHILASFWWAVATLTTVGYGDVYPITGIGKFISGIIALMGIGLVALPTGLISASFMSKIEARKKKSESIKCPHCNNEIEM